MANFEFSQKRRCGKKKHTHRQVGRKVGRQEGRKVGREEGRRVGRQQGREVFGRAARWAGR